MPKLSLTALAFVALTSTASATPQGLPACNDPGDCLTKAVAACTAGSQVACRLASSELREISRKAKKAERDSKKGE